MRDLSGPNRQIDKSKSLPAGLLAGKRPSSHWLGAQPRHCGPQTGSCKQVRRLPAGHAVVDIYLLAQVPWLRSHFFGWGLSQVPPLRPPLGTSGWRRSSALSLSFQYLLTVSSPTTLLARSLLPKAAGVSCSELPGYWDSFHLCAESTWSLTRTIPQGKWEGAGEEVVLSQVWLLAYTNYHTDLCFTFILACCLNWLLWPRTAELF